MDEIGRRTFIRKAAVAGAIVWTVPTIVSIDPASAATQRGSAKPKPPVTPPIVTPTPMQETGGGEAEGEQLPFTGDNEIIELGVGVAAVTAGAAMLVLGKEPIVDA